MMTGIGVHHRSECVFTFARNGRSRWAGIRKILLERLNRLGIDSSRSLIRFDPLVHLPHNLLGNIERLSLTQRFLPLARLTESHAG